MRARSQGSRGGRRRPTPTGTPNDRGTTRGFLPRRARPTVPRAHGASWSPPHVTSRTRLRHRRSDKPCGRSFDRPHGVRLGGTMRVHIVRIVRAQMAVPYSGRSGQPRVDSTTTGHRCWSTRDYHAWTKWITGTGRQLEGERERAVLLVARDAGRMSVSRPTSQCSRSSAYWHDRPRVKPSTRPSRSRIVLSKRTANESRHLRPVLVGEPAGRVDR